MFREALQKCSTSLAGFRCLTFFCNERFAADKVVARAGVFGTFAAP